MYTIHNLAFQGNFPADVLTDCLGIDRRYFDDGSMRFHNGISFMKTGIIFSDKITTVSPSYSQEILTAQYGEQMDEVLRFRQSDLYGIVNGIDTKMWDPMTDRRCRRITMRKPYWKASGRTKPLFRKSWGCGWRTM